MTAPSVESANVASRFKLMDIPYVSPGKCAVCGAVSRPVVEFGLNIQRYGAVMLCVDCVCEAADRVGMVRPEKLENDTLQTGQSVEDYLTEHGLKVVTNELHDALTHLVGVCATHPSDAVAGVLGSVDVKDSEVPSGQYELDFDESDGKSEEFTL